MNIMKKKIFLMILIEVGKKIKIKQMTQLTFGDKRLQFDGGTYLTIPTPDLSFKITVDTTKAGSASDTIIIPTTGSGFDCEVFWGDGSSNTYTGTPGLTTIQHTYDVGGIKQIKIVGTFPRIYFNNTGDKLKLISVDNWGNYGDGVSIQNSAFRGCANNISIADDWKLDTVLINGSWMFASTKITSLPDSMLLSSLVDGERMFYLGNLISLPPNMTLDNLEHAEYMFTNCSITSLPSNMTLDNLISFNDFGYMFQGNKLESLPYGMTLSGLTSGGSLFRDNLITELPPEMTLSGLIDGGSLFNGNLLSSLPSGMTLDNLVSAVSLFSGCDISSLPSGMTLPVLGDGYWMFSNTLLTSLPDGITLSLLVRGERMFYASQLLSLPSGMTLSLVTETDYMFWGCSITSALSLNLASLTNGNGMFGASCILNTNDYSNLLVRTEANNINTGVVFQGGSSKYNTSGETARDLLTSRSPGWTISDGGLA